MFNNIAVLGMAISSLTLSIPGLLKFFNLYFHNETLNALAGFLTNLHDWSGIVLGSFVAIHLILHWKWIFRMSKKLPKFFKWNRTTLQYLIDLGMVISFVLVLITGLLKFPAFDPSRELLFEYSLIFLTVHDWSGLTLAVLALTHVILHWRWIKSMSRKMLRKDGFKRIRNGLILIAIIGTLLIPLTIISTPVSHPGDEIHIGSIGTVKFDPDEVNSIRPDLFKQGHFSIFDILVNLDNNGKIDMQYHYDPEMNTHVIDALNGESNYWYYAYYDGGWQENNVFRMDHYPYKPKMYISLFTSSQTKITTIYNTFREEIIRINSSGGSIVIPDIYITSPTNNLHFENIEVIAHDLRNDTFQDSVITAIDVIMTLGDLGLISYKLNWYETIGSSEIKNYYVDGINGDNAYARCGFVYEAGNTIYRRFAGNHIHIPSDIRLINSPEYVEYFWICI